MTIISYFYDSVAGDRPYSAADFAKAFGIAYETGIFPKDSTGALGFDVGGTNFTTVYAGKAVIQGHFIELIGTELLTVPAGTYSGQIVLKMEAEDARAAFLEVKTDRTPIQTTSIYELPLYDATVANGAITAVTDIRTQGGTAVHTHPIDEIDGLVTELNNKADDANAITWGADPNGVFINMGKYNGTGKPIKLYLTSAQPAASPSAHHVWIQIDNF